MRITAEDRTGFVEIERLGGTAAEPEWRATAMLDGRRVTSAPVVFSGVEAFLVDLSTLIARGAGRAWLSGTNDFSLLVEAVRGAGGAAVSFYVAEHLRANRLSHRRFMRLALEGSLPLETDALLRLPAELRGLLAATGGG